MEGKHLKSAVFGGGMLVAGIGLGLFCFPQPASSTAPSPTGGRRVRAKSLKNENGRSAVAIEKSASGENGVKGSVPKSGAEKLAEFMASHPDISERLDFIKKLITELCSEGRDDEAYALIDRNSGHLREIGLFSFYSSASLDKNRLMAMVERESFDDLLPVFHGYMRGIGIDQLKAEAASSRLADFRREKGSDMPSDLIESAIGGALQGSLFEAGRPESVKVLALASDLAEKGTIKAYKVYELVRNDKNLNPFEKWDFLKQIDPKDADQSERDYIIKTREKLIDSMTRADGSKAMGDIFSNNVPGQASDVNTAVRIWNSLDSGGVADWYQQNQATLSPERRTMVATTLSTIAAESGEFESARQWANQIQDPAKKSEAMKMLDEKSVNYQKWLENKH